MKLARPIILLVLLAMACSKSSDSQPPESSKEPKAVNLEFPLKNSECTTGVEQGVDKTLVEFRWAIAENDSYELVLENLYTNQITRTTTINHAIEVPLLKNTPYRWYIISSMSTSNSVVESERWKFYAAGTGVSNYAPFPADLITPEHGATFNEDLQQLSLEWQSSDIDDDSITYDLYLGAENPPVENIATDLVESTFEYAPQTKGGLYWMVVAKDAKGNSSKSKVGSFVVGEETGIVSFEISEDGANYTADIDLGQKEIRIKLGNFDYEKLAPTIAMKEGYSINPASGEIFNFHDDLFYTVTDADGNESVYNVVIESGQYEVKSFTVSQGDEIYRAIIDSELATVTIEMGNFDYTNITPKIELSSRATVEVSQVNQMNLSTPTTFTVVSEIGTSKEFTVRAPIGMSALRSYFRNPGFEFSDSGAADTGYRILAGSTHYFYATNVQDQSQVNIELVNSAGISFSTSVFRSSYNHQHSFETSSSSNFFNVVTPSDLPGGIYTLRISEGSRSKSYPQRIEVINDNRNVRITEINKTDISRGDTLVMKGVNLKRDIMVFSNGNQYIFNQYTNDLLVNEDGTELKLIFSNNVYGNLKSWGSTNEKPLGVQTAIEGYPHKVSSNIVYFNVN